MKTTKWVMLAMSLMVMAGRVNAESRLYDGFGYTAGQLLSSQDGWTTGGAGAAPAISNGNMSVSGLQDSTGLQVYISAESTTMRAAYRAFGLLSSPTNLFASFALKVTSLGSQTNAYMFALYNAADYNVVCIRSNSTGNNTFDIGAGRRTGFVSNWDTGSGGAGYALNQTNFIVVGVTNNSGGSTVVNGMAVWVNPSSSSFGNATPPSPKFSADCRTGPDLPVVRIVCDANRGLGNWNVMFLDELRLGTTWADVTPIYVPPVGLVVIMK